MKNIFSISVLLLTLLFSQSYNVPDDFSTIQEAIDYSINDDTATINNGTCFFPNECDLCNQCDLNEQTIYITDDQELWYNVNETINGFQFDLYGITITDISNGDAQNVGFEVIYENGSTFSRVLGYSTSGSTISSGCGTLLSITFDGNITDISDIIFATTFGTQMNIDYADCP